MKKQRLIQLCILLAVLGLVGFLTLTAFTMYKQNHAVAVLEYHNFSEVAVGMDDPWTVSQNAFREQMAYLSQNCRVVSLKTFLQEVEQDKEIAENTVVITFDDGYRSNYLLAFPIIKQYKVPVTIFVVGDYIEKGQVADYPALRWSDMKEMTDSGLVDIQSHTYALHEMITDVSGNQTSILMNYTTPSGARESETEHYQRIENDLVKSNQYIESHLGTKPDILSWPFGSYDKKAMKAAKKAGFPYMVSRVAYSNPVINVDEANRLVVFPDMDMNAFKNLVQPRKVTYWESLKLQWVRIKFHVGRLL
ncbi:MAG: polysaccharide deacetylase family protein [Syntrophomonadaceae bacterium]